jgi:REP element-mobilizing transposase RayT
MSNPVVIAYHLIWTLYGWWLPNDLRGSTSKAIRSDALRELGELHFGRNKIQPASHEIKNFYAQAQSLLKYPLLELSTRSIAIVADGFAEAIRKFRYTCYACAILPDHVHLILRRHKFSAEQMIVHMQDASRLRLSASSLFPNDHPIWVHGGWKVFLDHPKEIQRTIGYIEKNPRSYGMPKQTYDFVTPYDNWPLHDGHDANSPYARALKAAGRYPQER